MNFINLCWRDIFFFFVRALIIRTEIFFYTYFDESVTTGHAPCRRTRLQILYTLMTVQIFNKTFLCSNITSVSFKNKHVIIKEKIYKNKVPSRMSIIWCKSTKYTSCVIFA